MELKKKVASFEKWVSMSAQNGDVLNMMVTGYLEKEKKDEKVNFWKRERGINN